MLKHFLLFLLPTLLFADGYKTNLKNPFDIVYGGAGANLFGDYVSLASSVQCVENDAHTACDHNYNSYLFDATTRFINDVSTATIPLNSSSKNLVLPSQIDGANIVYAGLFWQGHIHGTNRANYATGIAGREQVTLRDAQNTLHTINASSLWYQDFWGDNSTGSSGGYRSFYQGYADVTSILKASYSNTQASNIFTIGNIKSTIGKDDSQKFWDDGVFKNGFAMGNWGNWNLIVVYEYANVDEMDTPPPLKNITVFGGFDTLIPVEDKQTKTLELFLDGFITPLSLSGSNTISAKLLFYGSGGEQNLSYDTLEILDGESGGFVPLSNSANPSNNAFNGTISKFGINEDSSKGYYPGLDSDEFNVSDAMTTKQTSTTLKLSAKFISNSGDQFLPGMVTFSTDIYEPTFCYDYAYKQNNAFFTQENNGSINPSIVGSVSTGDSPITVFLYIRNTQSDISAEDIVLHIYDINTTQAQLDQTFFQKTNPGELYYQDVTPSSSTASSFALPLSTMAIGQGVYTKYQLTHITQSEINLPINAYINYAITVNGTKINYNERHLNSNIPLCTQGEYTYTPEWGIFNILDSSNKAYLDANNSNALKYNLFTQVAKRPYRVEIAAFDAADPTKLTAMTNFVGVELITTGDFHDINNSCSNPDNSVSGAIVWVPFDNGGNPITHKTFDRDTIQYAIDHAYTKLTDADDFYAQTHKRIAFRVWYMSNNDENNTAFEHDYVVGGPHDGNIKVKFFPNIAGNSCSDTISGTSTQASVICGNAGNAGVPPQQLANCYQCIFKEYAKPLCSRDDFSVRPESFDIKIFDIDHNRSGTLTAAQKESTKAAIPTTSTLAAGYLYRFDINATSHLDNAGTTGYSLAFNGLNIGSRAATFIWENNASIDPFCNNISSNSPDFYMANGTIYAQERLHTNVGKYTFSMIDNTFTAADQSASHHTGSHFTTGADCLLNSGAVPATTTQANASNMGCDTRSSHINVDNGTLSTSDYNLTFVPYHIDTALIDMTRGKNNTTIPNNTNIALYMSDLNDSSQMGLHYQGWVRALGEDNSTLSNFVTGCYAKDINITLSVVAPTPSATVPAMRIRHQEFNTTHSIIYDQNFTYTPTVTLPSGRFTKAYNGAIEMAMHLNFDRNGTTAVNGKTVTFKDFNTSCSTTEECTFRGDLKTDALPDHNMTRDVNATYLYGRIHAPRYRIDGATNSATIYYEAFCNLGNSCGTTYTMLGNESVDDVNWYINTAHDDELIDGQSTYALAAHAASTQLALPAQVTPLNGQRILATTYDGSRGWPFTAHILMTPDAWLVYDRFNINATQNRFAIEFFSTQPAWSGKAKNNQSLTDEASKTTNRRIQW